VASQDTKFVTDAHVLIATPETAFKHFLPVLVIIMLTRICEVMWTQKIAGFTLGANRPVSALSAVRTVSLFITEVLHDTATIRHITMRVAVSTTDRRQSY
jgi:hypothetical protein